MHFVMMLFMDPERHVSLYRKTNHNKLSKIYVEATLPFRRILICTLLKISNLILSAEYLQPASGLSIKGVL